MKPRAVPAVGRLPGRVATWAIGLCGLAVSAVSVTLALTNDAIGLELGEPLVIALLAVWITVAYVFGGLIAWSRRPESRFGPLMIVAGFLTITRVWDVLTAIDRWPAWNPDVRSVSIDGPVEKGSSFRWKAGPGTITSRVEHIDRPHVVAWSGRTLGIRAVHVWRLESRDGGTLARTEESYDGLVARMLRRSLKKMLDTALADGAGHLKAEAEKRESGSGSTNDA